MRATGDELTTLAGDRNFEARAFVQNGSGSWVDYSRHLVQADWRHSVNEGVSSGTLTFHRRNPGDRSLAPYNELSVYNVDDLAAYSPAIDGWRRVRLATASWPFSRALLAADWKNVFDGYVVDVRTPGSDVVCPVLDLAGLLQVTQIKESRTYGTSAGEPMETVLQNLLNDNLGAAAPTLVTPVPSNAMVRKYRQDRVRLYDALRAIAQQIGWEIRYVWNNAADGGAGLPELRFFEPPRTKTTPDFTFPPGRTFDVSGFDVGTENVRNFWRIYYFREGTRQLESVARFVQESIDRYGLRYAEINEEETSRIDTPEEAVRMAEAAVHDTAYPVADYGFSSLYNWAAEPWDLFNLLADNDRFTTAQAQGVVEVAHSVTAENRVTTYKTTGRVVGFSDDWLLKEGPASGGEPPAPPLAVTRMVGENSVWKGQLAAPPPLGDGEDDGMCMATFNMPKYVKRAFVHGRQRPAGETIELPAATSAGNLSQIIDRPDGLIPQGNYLPWGEFSEGLNGDWVTSFYVPTTPGYGRGVLLYGETYDGRFTPPAALKAVAMEATVALPTPDFSELNVGRVDPTTVRVTGTITTPATGIVFMEVIRDGVKIGHVAAEAGASTQVLVFDDPGLNPNKAYTYWVFPFMVSGSEDVMKTGWRIVIEVAAWTSGIDLAVPVAVNVAGAGEPEAPAVRLTWTNDGTFPTIANWRVMKSRDGGRREPWRDVSGVLPLATLTFDDRDYWAEASYRVEGLDGAGEAVDISTYQFFNGEGI